MKYLIQTSHLFGSRLFFVLILPLQSQQLISFIENIMSYSVNTELVC